MITSDGFETLQWLHSQFGLKFSDLDLPQGQISGFQILASATHLPQMRAYLFPEKFFLPYLDDKVKSSDFQSQLETLFRNPGGRFDILYHIVNDIVSKEKILNPQINEKSLIVELMNLLILPLVEEQQRSPLKEIGTVELLQSIYSNPYFKLKNDFFNLSLEIQKDVWP